MDQVSLQLPIRLIPHKGGQIGQLLLGIFMIGFSIFWMGGAFDVFDLNNGIVNPLTWDRIQDRPVALLGLIVTAVGIFGAARAILRMLPDSPYDHLQVSSDGLLVRRFFRQDHHAWRDLPPFTTIEVVKSGKHKTIRHYTVAVQGEAPPLDAPRSASYGREVVRIYAQEYGRRKSQVDADALTEWLNTLRDQALDKSLGANEIVAIPEPFQTTVMSVSNTAKAAVRRSQTVVRR
jgi:hypothetical protein